MRGHFTVRGFSGRAAGFVGLPSGPLSYQVAERGPPEAWAAVRASRCHHSRRPKFVRSDRAAGARLEVA